MNIELCKNCPRECCLLWFDFGESPRFGRGVVDPLVTPRVMTFNVVGGLRKASYPREYEFEPQLILEMKNGEMSVKKWLDSSGFFPKWDECANCGYPFKLFMEKGVLVDGDECHFYAENKLDEYNRESR